MKKVFDRLSAWRYKDGKSKLFGSKELAQAEKDGWTDSPAKVATTKSTNKKG